MKYYSYDIQARRRILERRVVYGLVSSVSLPAHHLLDWKCIESMYQKRIKSEFNLGQNWFPEAASSLLYNLLSPPNIGQSKWNVDICNVSRGLFHCPKYVGGLKAFVALWPLGLRYNSVSALFPSVTRFSIFVPCLQLCTVHSPSKPISLNI